MPYSSFAPYPNLPRYGQRPCAPVVGILGGSFNPAHEGHRHISLWAMRQLGLKEVWWLVSPQNPLKTPDNTAPLSDRLGQARKAAAHPNIHVRMDEHYLGTTYTARSLKRLKTRFPRTTFIWLMGMDNLISCHLWQNWQTLFNQNLIAILPRMGYDNNRRQCVAAIRFARVLRYPREGRILYQHTTPAWMMLPVPLHPANSTAIRNRHLDAHNGDAA